MTAASAPVDTGACHTLGTRGLVHLPTPCPGATVLAMAHTPTLPANTTGASPMRTSETSST